MAAGKGLWGTATGSADAQLPSSLTGGDPSILERYEKEQLIAGSSQHQKVPRTSDAILAVLQFTTHTGADTDLRAPNTADATFKIPGVPGGVGTIYGSAKNPKGVNAAFVVGEYEYVVGYAGADGQAGPGRSGVVRAAQAWYEKVSALS